MGVWRRLSAFWELMPERRLILELGSSLIIPSSPTVARPTSHWPVVASWPVCGHRRRMAAAFLLSLYLSFCLRIATAQSISTNTPLPPLQWINLSPFLQGSTAPPPLKDAALGYDESRCVWLHLHSEGSRKGLITRVAGHWWFSEGNQKGGSCSRRLICKHSV